MNVLILMAGEGKRFKERGIETSKPFIQVKGKSILEWTTRSLPFIPHNNEEGDFLSPDSLYFAVRKEHDVDQLYSLYGPDINIITFEKTTRGNLETAYTCAALMEESDSLLVLDSDNKYDDNSLLDTLAEASNFKNSMVISRFEPLDDSSKWAFAVSEGSVVKEIVEKDPTALNRGGKPMVGTFWFSSTKMFLDLAEFIMVNNYTTGPAERQEFYMSQVPMLHVANRGWVFAHTVTNVIPLGTPEDVEKFNNA